LTSPTPPTSADGLVQATRFARSGGRLNTVLYTRDTGASGGGWAPKVE
jgi:hypothetical protein